MLATDGDFNVGLTDKKRLEQFVEQKKQSGVYLTVLGFGVGNIKDTMLGTLANHGNGVAAYIDSLSEAQKVLSDGFDATMYTIAKDVKLQVEFNTYCVRIPFGGLRKAHAGSRRL